MVIPRQNQRFFVASFQALKFQALKFQALQHIPHPAIGAQYLRPAGPLAGVPLYRGCSQASLSYWRMLTARATTSATVTIEMADWSVIASFAQRDSGITSVGLNAAALVNARYR